MYYFGRICKPNYKISQNAGEVVHERWPLGFSRFSDRTSAPFLVIWNNMQRALYFHTLSNSESWLNYKNYWPTRIAIRRLGKRTAVTSKSLYGVLEVDPRATQKEIKSAYYKLSMTYHPDKNKDSEAASLKFREITEAYEILGNYLSRRKYDRGMIAIDIGGVSHQETGTESAQTSHRPFHRRPFEPRPAGTVSGHSPIYNFDEWTQMHYGTTFAKQQAYKRKQDIKIMQDREIHGQKRVEMLLASIVVVLMMSFGMYWSLLSSYDIVKQPSNNKREND